MTFKTISDQPKTFTFTYDFSDIDTAQVASHAVLGYMTGTYHAPAIESTIKGRGQLVLEYAEDSNLNKIFKRICDSFKDYYTTPRRYRGGRIKPSTGCVMNWSRTFGHFSIDLGVLDT